MESPDTNQLLQYILAEMTDAIYVYDHTGTITVANPAALELLGIEDDSKYQRNLAGSFDFAYISTGAPLGMDEHPHNLAMRGIHVTGKDYKLLPKHSTSKIVTVFSKPMADSEGIVTGSIVRVRNISVRLHSNQESNAGKTDSDQPSAADLELESFIYAVSHDLQAPLRHIMGFSSLLSDEYSDNIDDKGSLYIKRMQDACANMQHLIIDLLKMSRNTRGRMFRSVVNLSEIAKAVVTRMKEIEPSRKIDIEIQDGLETEGDQRLLIILLEHLLGNAWKFTNKEEEPRIEFGSKQFDGERVFFIKDNGVGIDLKKSDKLFLPFRRFHGSDFEGNGIGLATALRIINRHEGKIWIESEFNYGTTVLFTLG